MEWVPGQLSPAALYGAVYSPTASPSNHGQPPNWFGPSPTSELEKTSPRTGFQRPKLRASSYGAVIPRMMAGRAPHAVSPRSREIVRKTDKPREKRAYSGSRRRQDGGSASPSSGRSSPIAERYNEADTGPHPFQKYLEKEIDKSNDTSPLPTPLHSLMSHKVELDDESTEIPINVTQEVGIVYRRDDSPITNQQSENSVQLSTVNQSTTDTDTITGSGCGETTTTVTECLDNTLENSALEQHPIQAYIPVERYGVPQIYNSPIKHSSTASETDDTASDDSIGIHKGIATALRRQEGGEVATATSTTLTHTPYSNNENTQLNTADAHLKDSSSGSVTFRSATTTPTTLHPIVGEDCVESLPDKQKLTTQQLKTLDELFAAESGTESVITPIGNATNTTTITDIEDNVDTSKEVDHTESDDGIHHPTPEITEPVNGYYSESTDDNMQQHHISHKINEAQSTKHMFTKALQQCSDVHNNYNTTNHNNSSSPGQRITVVPMSTNTLMSSNTLMSIGRDDQPPSLSATTGGNLCAGSPLMQPPLVLSRTTAMGGVISNSTQYCTSTGAFTPISGTSPLRNSSSPRNPTTPRYGRRLSSTACGGSVTTSNGELKWVCRNCSSVNSGRSSPATIFSLGSIEIEHP